MASPLGQDSTDLRSEDAEVLKQLGNQYYENGEYIIAIDYYTGALELKPDKAVYLSNRAAAYFQAGDYKGARTDAARAVELDPNYAKAWGRLGVALYRLEDGKGCMEAYANGLSCGGGQTQVLGFSFENLTLDHV